MLDHRRAIHHTRVGLAGACAAAPLGARHARLFLRPPYVQHALLGIEAPQILLGDVVFAHALGELHHVNASLGRELLYRGDERLGLGRHTGSGGEALSQVAAQVPHDPTDALQLRYIHVQVHPVDAFGLQNDVITQDFAHAVW